MGKANVTVNQYLENNERFADLFNVAFFKGKKVVSAEELSEMDTKARRVSMGKNGKIYGEEYVRDQLKKWKQGADLLILGLESEAFRYLSEDAYDVIASLGNEAELAIKKEEYQNEEGYDMCLALQQMCDESFAKGKIKGSEMINLLGRHLMADGRTEDFVRSVEDDEFQLALLREYGLI